MSFLDFNLQEFRLRLFLTICFEAINVDPLTINLFTAIIERPIRVYLYKQGINFLSISVAQKIITLHDYDEALN